MKIRAGYKISYDCAQLTPMITMLNVHPSRLQDLVTPDDLILDPAVPANSYRDGFGNICHVIHAPKGRLTISSDFVIRDSGKQDDAAPDAEQYALEKLPVETLVYLLGSRYCETDLFTELAWAKFGNVRKGWPLVQAICDYVHSHLTFGYEHANPTKTAWQAHSERRGVCRDFAHVAITLCRCMNVPARYCTGYLGDIGVPPEPDPMDFSAWFEVYLGRWYAFDARYNTPRIGRILMARGRDATDVAIVTSFGPCKLAGFQVITDELIFAGQPVARNMPERQLPPPWSVEEKSAHFAICDSNGQALAFVYFEKESSRRSAPNLLSKDEARRIATQMARVPELLQKEWINRSKQAE